MEYIVTDVPIINKNFSYSIHSENKIICYVEGQIKVLYCETKIFEECLSYIDGKMPFSFIENTFSNRYKEVEIKEFISVLLNERVIKVEEEKEKRKKLSMLVIGNNSFEFVNKSIIHMSTEQFLKMNSIHDFDYTIIVDENLNYSDILLLNRKLYNLGKLYTQIRFDGESIVLGPIVLPNKTACLECDVYASIRKLNKKMNNMEKLNVKSMSQIQYSFNITQDIKQSQLQFLLDMLISDIENLFNGKQSQFIDYQYKFNIDSMDFIKVECLPTTVCDFCHAFNKHYVIYDPKKMALNELLIKGINQKTSKLSSNNVTYMIGGLRSKSECDTEKILVSDFEKIGAKVHVTPAVGNPFHDNGIVNCFNSNIEMANNFKNDFLIRKNEGAGKGITEKQSFFSASFELLKHSCLQYRGDVPIISAKYKDIKDIAIDMHSFSKTIKNTITAFDKFDENDEIDWVAATSVKDNKCILVPASFVFMYDVDVKGTFFGATSNGAAAGTTLEDAILHGILESIERDAWIIGQSNPYILPIVDYSTIKSDKVKETVQKIKHLGYDIMTRDYTNDIGIPVYRTWIVDKKNYSKYAYMGFGCHIVPELAIERSITEAVQIDDWSETGGEVEPDMINLSVLSNSLINIYNQHYLVNRDIFGKTNKKSKIMNSEIEFTSTFDAIKKVADIIKKATGADIYYVNLSHKDMQTKVVRVVIVGDFQMMNIPLISVVNRLFEFGINCGYSNKSTIYEELFLGKYQH